MRLSARGLAAKRLKTVASGLQNIPTHGPVLIVARHYHHLYDGLALFAVLPRPFHIVVTMDWVQTKPTKIFMESINRWARWPMVLRGDALLLGNNDKQSLFSEWDAIRYKRAAMRQCVDLLVQGRMKAVPTSTRSTRGRPSRRVPAVQSGIRKHCKRGRRLFVREGADYSSGYVTMRKNQGSAISRSEKQSTAINFPPSWRSSRSWKER